MAYLETHGVGKRFTLHERGGDQALALSEVSLAIERGTLVAIVGPSGCGKSTLLQIMAGLISASTGEVCLNGRPITAPPFEVVYVFQQYTKSIFPWKTVWQNVAFGLQNRKGLDKTTLAVQCAEYIRLVDLAAFENHFPWQLSGGMQQRVAIARALACQPDVLLMDEPFSSVDAMTRAGLQDLLLRLWQEFSLTVVFVTHDVDEAVYLSQRVIVMSATPGRVVGDIPVPLAYPRDQLVTREAFEYIDLRRQLYQRIFPSERAAQRQVA
ncbi:MAG: ABC transporter ATP-binding protein [Anaerolineales bacterium]|nr:ABC transporter ATP-binding protein [Anaerolineales bacterium]